MAIIFRCPSCGANIPDCEDQSVLTCRQCGTTVTKYIRQVNQVDVNIRDTAKEEKQKRKQVESITSLIETVVIFVFFIAMMLIIYFVSK